MIKTNTILYDWTPDDMLEVDILNGDNFLIIKETLTRIGLASKKRKALSQSCHILFKRGHYYIVNFKELILLDEIYMSTHFSDYDTDNYQPRLTTMDIQCRNRIAYLLQEWGLLKIISKIEEPDPALLRWITVIPSKDKDEWVLEPKYKIGKKKHEN